MGMQQFSHLTGVAAAALHGAISVKTAAAGDNVYLIHLRQCQSAMTGETILKENEPGQGIFILVDGNVQLMKSVAGKVLLVKYIDIKLYIHIYI